MPREPYSQAQGSLYYSANGVEARHLASVCDDMAAVIAAVESVHLDIDGDGFRAVARAIVDQQISVHAARSIWLRFERLLDGDVSAQSVLAADADDMRGCGLSRSKIAAIKDLSQHVIDGHIDFATLEDLPDEEIIEALTQVRGVGRWTAQMYLMFALGRPDVFASADGGLRRAVEQLLGLEPGTPPQAIEAIAEDWAPYRSVAALFLWRSLQ